MTELAIGATAAPAVAAAISAGQLFGFDRNAAGQLGSAVKNGSNDPNPTPALITLPGAIGPVAGVATGDSHSLALTSTGQLYSFGLNYFAQLGRTANIETFNPNPTPAPVTLPGASGPTIRIAAGEARNLALTSTGQLYAFGNSYYGQLGRAINNGTDNPNPDPGRGRPGGGDDDRHDGIGSIRLAHAGRDLQSGGHHQLAARRTARRPLQRRRVGRGRRPSLLLAGQWASGRALH